MRMHTSYQFHFTKDVFNLSQIWYQVSSEHHILTRLNCAASFVTWRQDIYGSTEGKDLNGPRHNLGLGPRSNGLWHCLRSRLITGWSMWVGQPYFISLSQSPNICPISMWWLIKTPYSIAGCNIFLHKILSLIGNYVTFSKITKQAQKGNGTKIRKESNKSADLQ